MVNQIWWIMYSITILVFIFGVYVFFNKKLRKKVNMKQVWSLFILISVLRILDILSTIYFTTKMGVEYEGNLIARLMMSYLGITFGMSTLYLLSLPFTFFWFVLLNYLFSKNFGWRFFQILMVATSIIVPIYNCTTV